MSLEVIKCEDQFGKRIDVSTETSQIRFSAYGILQVKDKLLVVKTHLPLWEFPGGRPENGESLIKGMQREFEEEVGISVIAKDFLFLREYYYISPSNNIYHSLQHFFIVKPKSLLDEKSLKNGAFVSVNKLTKRNMNASSFMALKCFLEKPTSNLFFIDSTY